MGCAKRRALVQVQTAGGAENDIEINYMVMYANNGAYKIAVTGKLVGEHEGDWEHITVRCTARGALRAVYYGAHRHGDGTWVAGADVPRDAKSGRIIAFVARNGHGTYPAARTYRRIFGVANDVTSAVGPVWAPRRCLVVPRPSGSVSSPRQQPAAIADVMLPIVEDRGGKLYTPVDAGAEQRVVQLGWQNKAAQESVGDAGGRGPYSVTAVAEAAPWLEWRVRWGTQLTPSLQEWFRRAEHPSGSSTVRRTLLPCVRN